MEQASSPEKIEGSIFAFLSRLFKKHAVRGVLVGGYALIANRVQRMTFDIDFLLTSEDSRKIENEILSAGYSIFNRQDAFVQFRSSIAGLRDIDFLLTDRRTVENIIADGKEVVIAGANFVVPSPLHLIRMKLHAVAGNVNRELKDVPDIVQLMRVHQISPRDPAIHELFLNYKLEAIYQKIIHSFRC